VETAVADWGHGDGRDEKVGKKEDWRRENNPL
jgi:hypothetical protein